MVRVPPVSGPTSRCIETCKVSSTASAPSTVVERSRTEERCCDSGRAAGVTVQKTGLWLDFSSHCQDTDLTSTLIDCWAWAHGTQQLHVEVHGVQWWPPPHCCSVLVVCPLLGGGGLQKIIPFLRNPAHVTVFAATRMCLVTRVTKNVSPRVCMAATRIFACYVGNKLTANHAQTRLK